MEIDKLIIKTRYFILPTRINSFKNNFKPILTKIWAFQTLKPVYVYKITI